MLSFDHGQFDLLCQRAMRQYEHSAPDVREYIEGVAARLLSPTAAVTIEEIAWVLSLYVEGGWANGNWAWANWREHMKRMGQYPVTGL